MAQPAWGAQFWGLVGAGSGEEEAVEQRERAIKGWTRGRLRREKMKGGWRGENG